MIKVLSHFDFDAKLICISFQGDFYDDKSGGNWASFGFYIIWLFSDHILDYHGSCCS